MFRRVHTSFSVPSSVQMFASNGSSTEIKRCFEAVLANTTATTTRGGIPLQAYPSAAALPSTQITEHDGQQEQVIELQLLCHTPVPQVNSDTNNELQGPANTVHLPGAFTCVSYVCGVEPAIASLRSCCFESPSIPWLCC